MTKRDDKLNTVISEAKNVADALSSLEGTFRYGIGLLRRGFDILKEEIEVLRTERDELVKMVEKLDQYFTPTTEEEADYQTYVNYILGRFQDEEE